MAHLGSAAVGDKAAALPGDALGCEKFRLRLVRLAESPDDLAPVAAAVTEVRFVGLEAAASIPVRSLADMEAAESIPVGALAEVLEREASPPRACAAASCEAAAQRPGSNPVSSLFAQLRRVFD